MFRKIFHIILILIPYLLAAQPDSIHAQGYIHGNNINALVNANGLMFYDKEIGGQFFNNINTHNNFPLSLPPYYF